MLSWSLLTRAAAHPPLLPRRAVRFTPRALLLHPTQSMFLGLWPLALTALTAGLPTFWARWFDAAAVTTAALVLWALCFAAAMVFSLLLPHIIFTQQKHGWAGGWERSRCAAGAGKGAHEREVPPRKPPAAHCPPPPLPAGGRT